MTKRTMYMCVFPLVILFILIAGCSTTENYGAGSIPKDLQDAEVGVYSMTGEQLLFWDGAWEEDQAAWYRIYDSETGARWLYPYRLVEDNSSDGYSMSYILERIGRETTPVNIVFPKATIIEEYEFEDCYIKNIVLPDSVQIIGEGAFKNCKTLTGVNLPKGIVEIGRCAFYGCSSLVSMEIPHGVTIIADRVFSQCTALQEVVIPNSVTSICQTAFGPGEFPENLETIRFTGTEEEWNSIEIVNSYGEVVSTTAEWLSGEDGITLVCSG